MCSNSVKYSIIQSNGQRICRPSNVMLATPPRGCEVFVGNLPRDLYEDELIDIFSQVGPIYKLRLMMDFSVFNRGFGFVTYTKIEDARTAVTSLNKLLVNSPTRQSRITVNFSVDNCTLFFGNVPKDKVAEEIKQDLVKIIDGVVRVITYDENVYPPTNRGFAFVEFDSHASAALARKKFLVEILDLWNNRDGRKRIIVDWAEPEPVIVDPILIMEVKALYFKNVPVDWSTERFKKFLSSLLRNLRILKIYKKNSYAFVHFYTRTEAEMTLNNIQSISQFLVVSNKEIKVEWARPREYSKRSRDNHWPENFCKSVPPRRRKLVYQSKKMYKQCERNRIENDYYNDLVNTDEYTNKETPLTPTFQMLEF